MNYTEMLFNRDERLIRMLNDADNKNLELIVEINKQEEELERYKNIVDKAIEYTKRLTNGKTSRIDTFENVELVLETILSILKGE